MRTYSTTPAAERLLAKVHKDADTGCWNYQGGLNSKGYGVIWGDGRSLSAHRVSYEHHVGPITAGQHLDHLCRNRACVNPDHLEPVTPRVNLMRSPIAPAALNVAKTECPAGHAYDARDAEGGRTCRRCRNEQARRYRQRRAAA